MSLTLSRTTIEASNLFEFAKMTLTAAPLERPMMVTAPGDMPTSRLPASMARNTLTPSSSCTVSTSTPYFL